MTDYKDRDGGGYSAGATQIGVVATSIQAVPSASNRIGVRIHNFGAQPVFLQYSGAASSNGFPLIPSAAIYERDHLGQITAACATGASSTIAVNDVRF